MTPLDHKISEYKKTLVCQADVFSDSIDVIHKKTLCDCQVLEIIEGYEKLKEEIERLNQYTIGGYQIINKDLQEKLDVAVEAYDIMRDAALLALDCECSASERLCGHKTICQAPHIEYKINLADEALNKIRGDKSV